MCVDWSRTCGEAAIGPCPPDSVVRNDARVSGRKVKLVTFIFEFLTGGTLAKFFSTKIFLKLFLAIFWQKMLQNSYLSPNRAIKSHMTVHSTQKNVE